MFEFIWFYWVLDVLYELKSLICNTLESQLQLWDLDFYFLKLKEHYPNTLKSLKNFETI